MIGRAELARYRALEALLPDPKLADPDPKRAAHIPPDQESFLKAYESREAEMISFLKEHNLVTLPGYLGPFQIRQLPEAFKPTSPGGFMNPPGVYDKDPTGSHIQYGIEEFLYSRGNRRPTTDSRTRRHSRTFSSTFNCQSSRRRNPPSAWRFRVHRRLGALRRRDVDAHRSLSKQLAGAGTDSAPVPLSCCSHWS